AVRFLAVDDGDGTGTPLTAEVVIAIRVLDLNRPPVIETVGNQVVERDGTLTLTVRASDPDGQPVSLAATSEQPGFPLPAFMTFTDHGDGTATLQVDPRVGDRGDHAIKLL